MGNLTLNGSSSGQITISPPAVAGTNTLTLPAATGTVALTSSPTFSGTVTATTVTSPAATALTLQSAGTTALYIDTSQNVGIGTTSPAVQLQVYQASSDAVERITTGTSNMEFRMVSGGTEGRISTISATPLTFRTSNAEAMRIDSSGELILKRTTAVNAATIICSTGQNSRQVSFVNNNNNNEVGFIFCNNDGTTTQYSTTSDYRLKENVTPITTGLETVSALKPVTYDWVGNNSKGEGFLAHELQTVIPNAVTGEKDAVNAEGKPVYQGVDYSKIVVHLVAALQELKSTVDAQAAEITALKAKVGA